MIRLDAATVLLQWAVGGMFFCWFTTRRREVGLGYGWLLRGIYLSLAVGSAIVGFRYTTLVIREVASIGVAAGCAIALVVSVARRRAGVRGKHVEHDRRTARVAAMTGIERGEPDDVPRGGREFPPVLDLLPVAVGSVGLVAAALDAGGSGAVSIIRTLAGAAFLGAVTTIVLVFVTRAALKERQYSAIMAATGLLYLAILTAFGTDLVARAVLDT